MSCKSRFKKIQMSNLTRQTDIALRQIISTLLCWQCYIHSLRSGECRWESVPKLIWIHCIEMHSKKTNCFSNAHQISELMKMSKLNGCSTISLSASFLYLHRSSWRAEFWVAFSRVLKYVLQLEYIRHGWRMPLLQFTFRYVKF